MLGSAFSELPAHPRHVSPVADSFRERYGRPPALDDKGLQPGNLLAAFKGAARYMGVRGNVLVAIDYFFAMTRPQDWMGDARPIVWPSAREQSEALGLSPSGVKFLNRRL
ncbi:MAG TPA: helix-turn-helix domain-containing protein, partial [Pirellulales bacterium]